MKIGGSRISAAKLEPLMFMAKMGHQKTKTVDDVTHWRNEALFIHMNVGKDPLAPRLNAVGNFHFFRKG